MAIMAFEAHLADLDGMPKDDAINTFWVANGPGGTAAALDAAVRPLIPNFYNVGPGGLAGIASYISTTVDRTANKCSIHSYVLSTAISTDGTTTTETILHPYVLGSPYNISPFTLAAAGATSNLPREVSCALSLQADVSGVREDVPDGATGPKGDHHPRASHRGRIFLGPLNTAVLSDAGADAGIGPTINSSFRNAATQAAKAFADALIAVGTHFAWVIFSRVLGLVFPIVTGWVDDAFDMMKKRALPAIARTVFAV